MLAIRNFSKRFGHPNVMDFHERNIKIKGHEKREKDNSGIGGEGKEGEEREREKCVGGEIGGGGKERREEGERSDMEGLFCGDR